MVSLIITWPLVSYTIGLSLVSFANAWPLVCLAIARSLTSLTNIFLLDQWSVDHCLTTNKFGYCLTTGQSSLLGLWFSGPVTWWACDLVGCDLLGSSHKIKRSCQDSSTGRCARREKKRLTKKEMGGQHQRVDQLAAKWRHEVVRKAIASISIDVETTCHGDYINGPFLL